LADFVFRADASLRIGTGHVMRCLTLAAALREHGATCAFACREQPGDLIGLVRQRGFEVYAHQVPSEQDWQEDARRTLAALGAAKPRWLVVDHYGFDARWEREVMAACAHLMAIDDLADRPHACELLLDQNWQGVRGESRYDGLVPPDCRLLLGPGHALVRPEYSRMRAWMPPRDGCVRRILVFVGGSDPANFTGQVLEVLAAPAFAHLAVDVVLGTNHPDVADIETRARARPATHVHQALPSLAGLMARADFMIGGGGSTTWERMCLGLPALVVSMAENQSRMNEELMEEGYLAYLGEFSQVRPHALAEKLGACLGNPALLRAQSSRMQALVDGEGVDRVCAALLGAST
jgi:UDP-2,4-diacetamido-2,4,6-trideoxy-beta-L-altropyranose hydrolase